MGGVKDAQAVPLMTIMQAPPWHRLPVIRHGQEGSRTDLVCGFLHSDDPLFDPRLRVFPRVFVIRPATSASAGWVQANIAYALDQADTSPLGPDSIPSRLPELLLIEVLREHLRTAPAADHGWVAALRDPVLRPALAAVHQAPEPKWNVESMARTAATSRSQLDARFRQVWVSHRSGTSPTGACTWPKTCWPPPISAWPPSHGASAMTPRRRSAVRSNVPTAHRPEPGAPATVPDGTSRVRVVSRGRPAAPARSPAPPARCRGPGRRGRRRPRPR